MVATRKVKFHNLLTALLISNSLYLMPLATQAADGDIKIAGQTVFSALSASGSASIAQRADTIQNNLDNALVAAKDRSPNSVDITYVKGSPVITLGGYQVVTVDSQDASLSQTTPALLAKQWADSMRAALVNQNSINNYVAQLTGSYAAGAPPAANPQNNGGTNYSPYNGARPNGYDSYNNNPGSGNYGGGSIQQNGYPQQGNTYTQGAGNPQLGGGYPQPGSGYVQGGGYRQGRVAYCPAGQVIPITLATSISTQVARSGDLIQANITQSVNLGDSQIPAGSIIIGQVTDAEAGRRLGRSGELGIKFNRIRTPDGTETPISAHIVGGIGKYASVGGTGSDTYKGETMKNKVGSVAFRGLLGAGGGAALGTAVGAIAGGGHGAGMGAWSGAALGGGLGAADSLLLRKGKDVTVPSGTNMQLVLDQPVSIAGAVPSGSMLNNAAPNSYGANGYGPN